MTDHLQHTKPVLYINGQWLAGEAEPMSSYQPATNEVLWQGAAASASQVNAAVTAAQQAAAAWSEREVSDRDRKSVV